ncbi:MAG TPA: acyl-CoA dehydrogenase family protein [Caulobacteraceae bacterium]
MSADAEELLGKVRALAPEIRERAAEAESLRRIPPDLIAKLKAAGVFRMFAPRSHGGLELDFPEGLKVISEVARADGSAGWTVMIGSATALILSRAPRQTFDEVFAAGPDLIQAGLAGAPRGRAERVQGGYRVSGEWPFSSGCEHADFIIGACVVTEGGEPLPGPVEGGPPLVRIVGLPASAWTIKDTWTVAGLKGTGSHTTALSDAFVPEAQTLELGGPSCLPGPLYAGLGPWIPLMHGAFAVGMARGMIDDLCGTARSGRRQLFARASMQDSPIFQYELGALDAEAAAAAALLEVRAQLQWGRAQQGELSPAAMPDSLQAGVFVTHAALHVASAGFTLAGASALYEASPIQRRMRDMHAGAQHAVVQKQNYQGLGAALVAPPA